MISKEVQDLLNRHFADELSAEEFVKLNKLIKSDYQVAKEFAKHLVIEEGLNQHFLPTKHLLEDDLDFEAHKKALLKIAPSKSRRITSRKKPHFFPGLVSTAAIVMIGTGVLWFYGHINNNQKTETKDAIRTTHIIDHHKIFNHSDEIDIDADYALQPFSSISTPRAQLAAVKSARLRKSPKGWVLISGAVDATVGHGNEWYITTEDGAAAQVLGTRFTFGVYTHNNIKTSFLEVREGSVRYHMDNTSVDILPGERADQVGSAISKHTLPKNVPPFVDMNKKAIEEITFKQYARKEYHILKRYRLNTPRVRDICVDHQGSMWLSILESVPSENKGVVRINLKSGYIDRFIESPEDLVNLHYISGKLLCVPYMSENHGLYEYDHASMNFTTFSPALLNNIFAHESTPNLLYLLNRPRFSDFDPNNPFKINDLSINQENYRDYKVNYDIIGDTVFSMYIGPDRKKFLAHHDLQTGALIKHQPPIIYLISLIFCMASKDTLWVYNSNSEGSFLYLVKVNFESQ